MRTDNSWFASRAETTWKVSPGRSFLLIVPHGSDDLQSARLIATWAMENIRLPQHCQNHRPVIVWITTDEATSSRHFVRKLGRKLSDGVQGGLAFEEEEYPSDELEGIISVANAAGVYPVVLIERFHAFAKVADEHLLSVLSALRTLEHSGQITTLALTPVPYDAIRRQLALEGAFPFVNSAYGDNHERAVMTPISRAEFVAAAVTRGIKQDFANRIFSLAGGPDVVFRAGLANLNRTLSGVFA